MHKDARKRVGPGLQGSRLMFALFELPPPIARGVKVDWKEADVRIWLQRTQQGLTTNPNFCPCKKNTRKTDISHFLRIPAANCKIKATAIPKSLVRFLRREETYQKLRSWSLRRPPSLPGPRVHPSCFWQRANLGEEDKEEEEVEALLPFKRGSPLPLLFLTQGFPPSAQTACLLESDLGSHRVDAVISPQPRARWSMRLL